MARAKCPDHGYHTTCSLCRPAADVQAQVDAAVERERGRVIGIFVGELQKLHEKTVLDCGDNSCLFATRRGGMRTNGGCRCIERLLDAAVARERGEWKKVIESRLNGYYDHTFYDEFDRVEYLIGTLQALAEDAKNDDEPPSMDGIAPGHTWERMPGRGWTLRRIDS